MVIEAEVVAAEPSRPLAIRSWSVPSRWHPGMLETAVEIVLLAEPGH
jgi:hypothetical protein